METRLNSACPAVQRWYIGRVRFAARFEFSDEARLFELEYTAANILSKSMRFPFFRMENRNEGVL